MNLAATAAADYEAEGSGLLRASQLSALCHIATGTFKAVVPTAVQSLRLHLKTPDEIIAFASRTRHHPSALPLPRRPRCTTNPAVNLRFSHEMKYIRATSVLLLVCLLGFACWQRFYPHDADFESSDAVWADGTVKIQGRDFRSILWHFEAYRLGQKKEDVTLVRITRDSPWMFLWSQEERSDPMWKMPVGPSHGLNPYIGGNVSKEERAELERRADAALAYWKRK